MTRWVTHPLTPARFEHFADIVNPNRRETHCWCLSHRVSAQDIETIGGGSREQTMRALAARRDRPGVITYSDGLPVGWCSISPRTAIPRLEASKLIERVDGMDVWSIICVVVRSGHRRQGVTEHLINGACDYAASRGAPAVEAYPVDAEGARIDLTMAFVGTRAMFEACAFDVIGQTKAIASKRPRLVMRRTL